MEWRRVLGLWDPNPGMPRGDRLALKGDVAKGG